MQELQVKSILLIEDDEMMRLLFRDTFWIHSTEHSSAISTTRSLNEAREYLNNADTPPDIIFMGLWLLTPHADGVPTREIAPSIDFIKELRSKEEYQKTCIVVYSRFDEGELKEQARDAGADYYLVKGEMTPREIVDFVERL